MKPSQILVCILSTFIVLAAVCALGAGRTSVLRIPALQQVLGLPVAAVQLADSVYAVAAQQDSVQSNPSVSDSIPSIQNALDSLVTPKQVELPKALPQTKLHLPVFYAALASADKQSIRVVHFGDSQIEEDRITMIIRRRLQERFGGGGIGLIPVVQTIPTCTAIQSISNNGQLMPNSSVKRYLAYGPASMRLKNSTCYGPMAQVARIEQPVEVNVELLRDRVPTRDYDRIRVLYSDSISIRMLPDSVEQRRMAVQPTYAESLDTASTLQQLIVVLDTLCRSSHIRLDGAGWVYGVSLETATGVQVDNIPMRGAAGTNFTSISHRQLASYFSTTNTALVIMQFGGNAMPALRTRAAVERYAEAMRQQIHFIKSAAGEASLLFIGPSDMITTVDGEQMSYPMLPYLDHVLAEMVAEQGGAYYSLFRLMGGAGSMFSWRDKGLAGEDMIHFTRAGAKKVGEMLAKQLLADIETISSPNDTVPQYMVNSK